jgi:hypothetical protein
LGYKVKDIRYEEGDSQGQIGRERESPGQIGREEERESHR